MANVFEAVVIEVGVFPAGSSRFSKRITVADHDDGGGIILSCMLYAVVCMLVMIGFMIHPASFSEPHCIDMVGYLAVMSGY